MSLPVLLESFEPRRLMSVVPVSTTDDSGPGSLRVAIQSAADGDTIDLRGVSGTIALDRGQFLIDKSLTLIGPGANVLAVDGKNANRAFAVNTGQTLSLSGITLTHGMSDTNGGAILNRGTLNLNNVVVSDNTAFLYGGGIYSYGTAVNMTDCTVSGNDVSGALEASGGGVYVRGGTLSVQGCTFDNNTTEGASRPSLVSGQSLGGAVFLLGTTESIFVNCTFGGNAATGGTGGLLVNNGQAFGGAIYADTGGTTTLNHCTVAFNSAVGGGVSINRAASSGGGVYNAGSGVLTLQSSIVAENKALASPDMLNRLIETAGNNLVGVFSGSSLINGLLGDKIGTALLPLAPGLNPLADNGGLTRTFGLAANSPAVNGGGDGDPGHDQRGLGRRDVADIGAFELNGNRPPAIAVPVANATANVPFAQPVAVIDADGDPLTVTGVDLPAWLSVKTVNGVPTLVGTPTENDAGLLRVTLVVDDTYQTASTTMTVRVGIAGIDLSPSGLLRVNGTEFEDELYVTVKDGLVKIFRDGFKRNYKLEDVKKVQVYGFAGNDTILVDVGPGVRASVNGGDGNDKVTTGDGADYIMGGLGDDKITAGGGRDRVDGDAGRDKIDGGAGNDTLHGGDGRDSLDGGAGRNYLFGDNGNDVLVGTLGRRDTLDGGEGDNVGYWNKSATVAAIVLAS